MGYFTFKGVSSLDMGVFIQELPLRPRAKKRMTEDLVIGRSGKLHTDTGAWEEIQLAIKLNVWNRANMEQLYAWLSGYGDLVFSDWPDRAWHAHAIEMTSGTRRRPQGRNFDTVEIKFTCEPFAYEAVPETKTVTGTLSIAGKGSVQADPLIRVTGSGSGSVTVGSDEVELSGLESNKPVLIDCGAKMAVFANEPDSTVAVTLVSGEWPQMEPAGTNTAVTVSGGITQAVVQPNWRWI